MSTFDRIQKFLGSALPGIFVDETVKGLRRRGIKEVKLVTRVEFEKLVQEYCKGLDTGEARPAGTKSNAAKRVELLLIEIERLRKEKSDLEHQRGLLENDRAQLSGRLDEIVNAGSKAFGEKITVEDIRQLLAEREELRIELAAHKEQSEQTRGSYEETVTGLRIEQTNLENTRDEITSQLKQSQLDNERLRSELEASRNLAANNKRRALELEQELEELRSVMREQAEAQAAEVNELKATIDDKDKEIEELKNPTVEDKAEAKPAAGAPRTLARRPATRRLNRARRVRDTTAFDFAFSGKQPTESKTTRRRRRMG